MKVGDRLRLTIADDTAEGKGIARSDGMVCFVDGAVAGDVCEAEVTEMRKNCAVCKTAALLQKSPDRVEPDCPVYDRCGGCTLRHVNARHALDCKRKSVLQALRRVGLDAVSVAETIATPEESCRNKVIFHFSPQDRDGARELGYYAGESHTVLTETTDCVQLPPRFREIAAFTRTYGGAHPAFFGEDLHALYLRQNRCGRTLVTLTTGGAMASPASFADFANALCQAFPDTIAGVLHATDPAGEANARGDVRRFARPRYTTVAGDGYLTDDFLGVRFHISPDGFFQVHHDGAAVLADVVLARVHTVLDGKTDARIVDLYCGSGFFALLLARAFPLSLVTGIELNEDAIRDAKQNARATGIGNVRFTQSDAYTAFSRFADTERPELVVVDPPRAGLGDKMCRVLANAGVPHIVYVSCNPLTLARDLRQFADAGYEIATIQPVDMFPRSGHVETVCLLSKLNAKQHIEVEVKMDELDITAAESKATYEEIKTYVLEHTGLKVSHLYIGQVKQKYGIIERENYNKPKSENARQPKCTPEKEAAIIDALRYFQMI